jgi:5'-nucleotidase
MPADLSKLLVIGISSRALFDLEEESRIYDDKGLQAFIEYQRQNEEIVLRPGSAFPIVKGLLSINKTGDPKLEVILLSMNHPDVSLRVFNSIQNHGLTITRAALTGGEPLSPYLAPFNVGLFLSQDKEDVQSASNLGIAAGLIYSPPPRHLDCDLPIKIGFDGDCVIFSDEAQKIFNKDGLEAFYRYEIENAKKALPAGPFAKFLRAISEIQGDDPSKSPVRVGLFTDRNMPAHERVIRTLRAWNIRIDQAFFLGGLPKREFIQAFGAHMYFDDKKEYCDATSEAVPTGLVLLPVTEDSEVTVQINAGDGSSDEGKFLLVCRRYLKRDYKNNEPDLKEWYRLQIQPYSYSRKSAFLEEFEESVEGTPAGNQRRAASADSSPKAILMAFLENLCSKFGSQG